MICTRWCSWNRIETLHTFVGVLPTLQGCLLTNWKCTSEVGGLSREWSDGRKCSCRTFWLPKLLQELPCQFVNNSFQPLLECAKRTRLAFLHMWYENCLWCEIILPQCHRVVHHRQAGGAALGCSGAISSLAFRKALLQSVDQTKGLLFWSNSCMGWGMWAILSRNLW